VTAHCRFHSRSRAWPQAEPRLCFRRYRSRSRRQGRRSVLLAQARADGAPLTDRAPASPAAIAVFAVLALNRVRSWLLGRSVRYSPRPWRPSRGLGKHWTLASRFGGVAVGRRAQNGERRRVEVHWHGAAGVVAGRIMVRDAVAVVVPTPSEAPYTTTVETGRFDLVVMDLQATNAPGTPRDARERSSRAARADLRATRSSRDGRAAVRGFGDASATTGEELPEKGRHQGQAHGVVVWQGVRSAAGVLVSR